MKKVFLIFCFILIYVYGFGQDEPLFEVKNDVGTTIFSVTPNGIEIMGMSFNATTDGTSLQLDDSSGKALFVASPDSVRFYLHDTNDESRGGFAIATVASLGDIDSSEFMDITPENNFIGHEAGKSNTDGENNTFIGFQSGLDNEIGNSNVFIGNLAGKSNNGVEGNAYKGCFNVFIGNYAGMQNTEGQSNVFIGKQAGFNNTTGRYNVYIGQNCAGQDQLGNFNTYVGAHTGEMAHGSGNVFIGYSAGDDVDDSNQLRIQTYNSDSLISGDFSDGTVEINDILTLTPRSGPPDSPTKGMIYFDNYGNVLKVYDGTQWQSLY